ncbi:hypothetical protein I9189_015765 [Acinetobacter bereziniae]|uniref:hypothetical protein n=1 Tax=Acinetobacter bereziniae TaxID=106648 RepID=UPI001906E968|nr:hypothetical protein [Acinetobacter bereziniae]QQC79442.1 hypothetical protein I9192_15900 [Acinetobacter bereziniae]UUN92519.1 hypothetical protein I9189_015765 [Acinetobacter bereziniae]
MAQLTADQLVQLARQNKGKSPVDLGQSSTTIGVDGEEIPKKSTQLTADQLVAMAKQQQRANFKPFDWKASQKEGMAQAAKDAGKVTLDESIASGIYGSEIGGGAAQAYYKARDLLSEGVNKVTGTKYLPTDGYNKFTRQFKDWKDFQSARREANNQGFDWAKLGTEIAVTAPLAALGQSYKAGVLTKEGFKSTAKNALLGSGIGEASFAEDSGDRLSNSIAGGIGGAAGGIVGQKIGEGVSKVVDKSTQLGKIVSAKFSQEKTQQLLQSIDEKLEAALRPEGISLNDLSQTIVNNLRDDAIKAVQSGKNLNPTAVARKVVLDRLGLKGTKAQVSGDAAQWQHEAELAKIQNAGSILRDKFINDSTQITNLLNDAAKNTGGSSIDKLGTAKEAGESLLNQLDQNKQFVNAAYDYASKASGGDILINGKGLANDVFTELEDKALASFLPSDIKSIVTQIEKNPQYFTLKKGEELIKVLNTHYKSSLNNGEKTATTHALGVVREALNKRQDEALAGLLTTGGNDAAQAYKFAREAYKSNSELKNQIPMLQDILKQSSKGSINYDDLYKSRILNGKVEELSKTMEVLKNVNPQAVANIKQEFIKDLTEKSLSTNGQFNPSKMKNALKAFGSRKLLAVFSPEEVAHLQDIKKAADYLITEPRHAYVNRSNSGSSLFNHFMSILNKPGVRVALSAVKDIPETRAVNQAMNPSIAGEAAPSIISPELIDRLVKAGIISGSNLPNQ